MDKDINTDNNQKNTNNSKKPFLQNFTTMFKKGSAAMKEKVTYNN
jgi:hypothetical protein